MSIRSSALQYLLPNGATFLLHSLFHNFMHLVLTYGIPPEVFKESKAAYVEFLFEASGPSRVAHEVVLYLKQTDLQRVDSKGNYDVSLFLTCILVFFLIVSI